MSDVARPERRRRPLGLLIHFLQGLLMGGADIIPGVSGGTMALIVGIYERLIAALSNGASAFVSFLRFDSSAGTARLREVEWWLVIPLGLGIVTALVLGARYIPLLLERYPYQSLGFFLGLVAGSIVIPWRRIEAPTMREYLVALVGAVAAFLLTGLSSGSGGDPALPRVFGSAAVAICAMILPGVSGAFLLKALGLYEVTLLALNSRDVVYILVFVLGAAAGLAIFSKVLHWLLRSYHDVTMAALVGLMVGALRALWPWQGSGRELRWPSAGEPVSSVVLIGAIGLVLVLLLAWWSEKLQSFREPAL